MSKMSELNSECLKLQITLKTKYSTKLKDSLATKQAIKKKNNSEGSFYVSDVVPSVFKASVVILTAIIVFFVIDGCLLKTTIEIGLIIILLYQYHDGLHYIKISNGELVWKTDKVNCLEITNVKRFRLQSSSLGLYLIVEVKEEEEKSIYLGDYMFALNPYRFQKVLSSYKSVKVNTLLPLWFYWL